MTTNDAIEILRAQGHAVGPIGEPAANRVHVWIHSGNKAVDVEIGRELIYLAEGKLTFDEILAKREAKKLQAH